MSGDILVSFEVLGDPAPQGDKSAIIRGGLPRLIEGKSANQRAKHGSWRDSVASAARAAAEEHGKIPDGPLVLRIDFRFTMPASVPKRVRLLGRAWKISAPDLDKLIRSVGDALKIGGLIVDDSRFVDVRATKTVVTDWIGATITIGVPQ